MTEQQRQIIIARLQVKLWKKRNPGKVRKEKARRKKESDDLSNWKRSKGIKVPLPQRDKPEWNPLDYSAKSSWSLVEEYLTRYTIVKGIPQRQSRFVRMNQSDYLGSFADYHDFHFQKKKRGCE